LEIQLRNWPKHLWLAGDSIVEQAIHSIDMMQWAMGEELPIEADGSGGRQVYPDDSDRYGNIYDHFAIVYKWANGTRGYHFSRQQNGTQGSYELEIFGKKGFCSAKNRHAIMVGIMGRMSAYTGKKLTFQQALNSKEDLTPPHLDFGQPLPVPGVPKPGLTKFI
jgi:myo-inositol 2-dehydrogenase/D-chiro-inositol 1-dehydrogenase